MRFFRLEYTHSQGAGNGRFSGLARMAAARAEDGSPWYAGGIDDRVDPARFSGGGLGVRGSGAGPVLRFDGLTCIDGGKKDRPIKIYDNTMLEVQHGDSPSE